VTGVGAAAALGPGLKGEVPATPLSARLATAQPVGGTTNMPAAVRTPRGMGEMAAEAAAYRALPALAGGEEV
jgi:hypothetical protein